jgi:predicted lipoprotein with Yx(FWY)xxD motif
MNNTIYGGILMVILAIVGLAIESSGAVIYNTSSLANNSGTNDTIMPIYVTTNSTVNTTITKIVPIVETSSTPDFINYGFNNITYSLNVIPGKNYQIPGDVMVDIPSNAFQIPVTFQLLEGNVSNFSIPGGQIPVTAFAFRVIDQSTGKLIGKFNAPVTVSIFNPQIESNTVYYNADTNGTLTANPTGMMIIYDYLTHPIKGAMVGWVVATPSANNYKSSDALDAEKTHLLGNTVPGIGDILVNENNMTLYINDHDAPGISFYNGTAFTPYTLSSGVTPKEAPLITGVPGVINTNGKNQVTYDGWPLYLYSGDHNVGDYNGEGLNNTWYTVNVPYLH